MTWTPWTLSFAVINQGKEFKVYYLPFAGCFELEGKRKLPVRDSAWNRMQQPRRKMRKRSYLSGSQACFSWELLLIITIIPRTIEFGHWRRWRNAIIGFSACLAILSILLCRIPVTHRDQRQVWEDALEKSYPELSRGHIPKSLGPIMDAKAKAVPFLLDKLEGTSGERLLATGATVIPSLAKRLEPKNPRVRIKIPYVLERIGADAREELPRMRRIFRSNPNAHLSLLTAIITIGGNSPEAMRFISSVASDPTANTSIRKVCATSLSELAPSKDVVNALTNLYGDPDLTVQEYVCVALGKQGSLASQQVPFLLSAFTNGNEQIRCAAIKSFGQVETNGNKVNALVLPLTFDRSPHVSLTAKQVIFSLQKHTDVIKLFE